MKKLLTILCLVLLVSCSSPPPPEVPYNKVVVRDGITYQINSDKPFTGKTVEFYNNFELIIKEVTPILSDRELTLTREVKEKISYVNGKREGVSEYFHTNGQFKKRVTYKNRKKSGLYEEFLINGELIKKIRYGITEGDTRGWSWDGKYNEEGQPKGEWESFDENGNLLSRENYKN